jgi:FkbM family methyltransferase
MINMQARYIKKFNDIKLLIGKEDPCLVEIGAHYGEDTLRFLETFPKCSIHCFEPDPRNIEIFKEYIDYDNVYLYPIALSNTTGTANFYQSYDVKDSIVSVPEKYSFIEQSDYNNNIATGSGASSLKKGFDKILSTCKVDTDTYHNWSQQNDISYVDFCWVDVQGAEFEVILGMGNQIQYIKHIWMEYGESQYDGALSFDETKSLLNSKGFELVDIIDNDIIFINKR